jgi:hypothetical protein
MGRLHRRWAAALALVVAFATLTTASATAAGVDLSLNPAAVDLARSMVATPSTVTGAAYESKPPFGTPTAVASGELDGFPTGGPGTDFAILTTGDASLASTANTAPNTGRSDGGGHVRGNTDYDVTVLRIDLDVPGTANCLVGMDFRFLSDEYPEYVGTDFNDAFVAEVDQSTWTTSGSTIDAPRNFAFDPSGNPITINAAGVTAMTAGDAAGTTYDGATPLLTAATPITPGHHSLYLSIFDQGDQIYDSAVFIDNLRFGHVGDVARDCQAGADLAGHDDYVALGDSYSSGFGVSPFFPGTHKDGTVNDCQRSQLAYGPDLAALIGLHLEFHACQGAVTQDFYQPRDGGSWGELPQLDYLNQDAGLVTVGIGGNDAHFADVMATCIGGWELLPFNTCHNDSDVAPVVAASFARLDNRTATPAEIVPYDKLMKDVRAASPFGEHVMVGYPPLFPAEGGDRTFLPGGRCEGVKKADQRWMVETGAELNDIIFRNAAQNGFLFVDPSPAFSDHELCSGGDEWFFGLLSSGRFHPTAVGQQAIAASIFNALDVLNVGPKETLIYRFTVDQGLVLLSVIIQWPGSDMELTLTSPSGKTYTRAIPGNGVFHANDATSEQFRIPSPEQGEWTASIYGANVKPGGERAAIQVYRQKPPNTRPIGAIDLRPTGSQLVLDGSRSVDPDGTITSWDWYVSTASTDSVYQGKTVSIPATAEPETITLVVTDNGGLTDFVTTATVPLDIKPGSDDNPISVGSKGVTPMALLSSAALDATAIDASTLKLGPKGASPAPQGVHAEDVNGDGRLDLMLQFPTQDIGVNAGMTTLCMTGLLPNERGRTFQACDHIRTS